MSGAYGVGGGSVNPVWVCLRLFIYVHARVCLRTFVSGSGYVHVCVLIYESGCQCVLGGVNICMYANEQSVSIISSLGKLKRNDC